MHVSV